MKPDHKHLYILDLLRGIAALSVCLFHFTGKVLPKVNVPVLEATFSWGWAGVEIFFVISGFIIPYVLFKDKYKIQQFGRFIGKRFIRICPPSYVVVLLFLVQWWFFDHVFKAGHTYLTDVSLPQVLHNFAYTAPFFKYKWINGVFWTLAVEFQYYILIGLVFTLAFKNIYAFILFCIVVAGLYYLPVTEDTFFFRWGVLFLIGCLTTFYFLRRISLGGYLLLLAVLSVTGFYQVGLTATAFGLATSLIISFIQFKSVVGTFLGKISYSLYLVHILCAPVLEVALIKFIPAATTAGKTTVQVLVVLATIGFAYLFYLLVEKYFINLAGRLFRIKDDR